MKILMGGLLAVAVYLAWGPLPVMRVPPEFYEVKSRLAFGARSLRKPQPLSPMPFLWTLHSEVMAGALIDAALLKACSALPDASLRNTHEALQSSRDVGSALEADAAQTQVAVLADVALIYRICARTGSPITDSLMRLISAVRDEQRRQRILAQETASAKATVAVLSALPLLGVLMGFGLGLNPLSWFLHSPLGILCFLIGIALEVLGWLWMRMLMQRASRSA